MLWRILPFGAWSGAAHAGSQRGDRIRAVARRAAAGAGNALAAQPPRLGAWDCCRRHLPCRLGRFGRFLDHSDTADQGRQFAGDFPEFLNGARTTVEGWVEQYVDVVSQDIRDEIEEALADAGDIVGSTAWSVVEQTLGIITGSFSFILALATAPVLVFYLMKDSSRIMESLHAPLPAALRPYFRDLLAIADRTMGGYIRGQLVLGLVVGTIVAVGLLALGIPFAVVLGIVAGLTELVPIIGPWIGGGVGVLVTLATEPDKILYVILLYLVIQMLENTLLVPRFQGETLNLHPVAVILVITTASHYFGLWGSSLGPRWWRWGRTSSFISSSSGAIRIPCRPQRACPLHLRRPSPTRRRSPRPLRAMTSEGVLLARPPLGGTLTPCPFECFHMRLLCVSPPLRWWSVRPRSSRSSSRTPIAP